MNRLAHWMMRLYPARWRRRYGDEMDALLADTGADARVVADLLRGGMKMQFSVQSFKKAAVGLGFAGFVLAGAGSFLLHDDYVSTARLRIDKPNEVIAQLGPVVLSRTSLSGIINDPRLLLYRHEQQTMPLEDVIQKMQRSIRIEAVTLPGASSPSAFDITFTYPDARIAQQTVAALISRFRDEIDPVLAPQRRLPYVTGKGLIDVVDTPNLPGAPFRSNIWFIVLPGALLGAVVPYTRRRLKKRPLATWGFVASVAAMALLGFIGAWVLASFDRFEWGHHVVRDQYRSTAVMSVQNLTAEQRQAVISAALSRTSLSQIINDRRLLLYQDELKTKPIDDVIEKMHGALSVGAINRNEHYFNISFEYADRFKAQHAVQAIMSKIDEANLAMAIASTGGAPIPPTDFGQLSVLNPPTLDLEPVWPNRPVIAAIGAIAGIFLAAIITLFRKPWEPDSEIPLDAVNG